MELFDLPPSPPPRATSPDSARLDKDTHTAVFGDLPTSLAAALHTAELGDLVLQLLDGGWRPGQLAARIGALPAGRDPESDITTLLAGFLEQVPPDARWRQEKAERAADQRACVAEQPASEESRQGWIQQIRTELGAPRTTRREPPKRSRPACALCGGQSTFFVTKEVRLCDGCVVLLSTGAVRLSEAG